MPKRIIPCLDIKNGKVAKGVKFSNFRSIGDPIKLAQKYSKEKADKLAILDVSASSIKKPFLNLVKRISETVKIPLIAGGEIRNLSDIKKLLKAGASKVCLYTSFIKSPEFLLELIDKIPEKNKTKKIIVGLDVKKRGSGWKIVGEGFKETDVDAIEWAKEIPKRGIKEILLTSMDRDGTKEGYDIELLRKLKENVSLSIIIAGGAGRKEDFLKAFTVGKANGALAASIFHSGRISISKLKRYLKKNSININL